MHCRRHRWWRGGWEVLSPGDEDVSVVGRDIERQWVALRRRGLIRDLAVQALTIGSRCWRRQGERLRRVGEVERDEGDLRTGCAPVGDHSIARARLGV